jgi:hypothetical protein
MLTPARQFDAEGILRHRQQIGTSGGISVESGRPEEPFCAKIQVERADHPRRLAELTHRASRSENASLPDHRLLLARVIASTRATKSSRV